MKPPYDPMWPLLLAFPDKESRDRADNLIRKTAQAAQTFFYRGKNGVVMLMMADHHHLILLDANSIPYRVVPKAEIREENPRAHAGYQYKRIFHEQYKPREAPAGYSTLELCVDKEQSVVAQSIIQSFDPHELQSRDAPVTVIDGIRKLQKIYYTEFNFFLKTRSVDELVQHLRTAQLAGFDCSHPIYVYNPDGKNEFFMTKA